jgi:hypothetical protein
MDKRRESKPELQRTELSQVLEQAKEALKNLKDSQAALVETTEKIRTSEAGVGELRTRLSEAIEKLALSAVASKHAWLILPNQLTNVFQDAYGRDEMGVDESYMQAVDSLIVIIKDQANTVAFLEDGVGRYLAENVAYFAEENGKDVSPAEISNRYRVDTETTMYGENSTLKGYLDDDLIMTCEIEGGAIEDIKWDDGALRTAVSRIVAEALTGETLEVDSLPQIRHLRQDLAEAEQSANLLQAGLERLTRRLSAQQRDCERLEDLIEETETTEWENAAIKAVQMRYPQLLMPKGMNADSAGYLKRHDDFNIQMFLSGQGAKPDEPGLALSGRQKLETLDTQNLEAGTDMLVKKLFGDKPGDWEITKTGGTMGERVYLHDPLAKELRQVIQMNCLTIAEANGQKLSPEAIDGLFGYSADESGESTLKFMGETIAEAYTFGGRTKMRSRPQNTRRAAAKFFLMALGRKDPQNFEKDNATLFRNASNIKSKLKEALE